MLLLVRHGESTGNADRLLVGRHDLPLTEHGRVQAAALSRLLSKTLTGPVRVVCSPLSRAMDTAEALNLNVPVEIDERWIELDYGVFDGEPISSVPASTAAQWRSDVKYRPGGGESLAEVGDRVRAACEELFTIPGRGARNDDVVVVSHLSPIKAAVCWAIGLPDLGTWRLQLATASVTTIAWAADGPTLIGFNERPWI